MKVCIVPILNVFDSLPVEYRNSSSICMNCSYAIMSQGINLSDEIVIGIYENHEARWNISSRITTDLNCIANIMKVTLPTIKFVYIDKVTKSMAETVMKIIELAEISENDSIFIKDADNSWSTMNDEGLFENSVTMCSLENMNKVDTTHKSYIKIDEHGFITNSIEKKVISDKFIAGGYSFKKCSDYINAYNALKEISDCFYISDMIFWLILNQNLKFRPIHIGNFKDYNI